MSKHPSYPLHYPLAASVSCAASAALRVGEALKASAVRAALTLTAALALASCSNIADDERLIYVKQPDVNRKVLVEDFTGQRCVNCPAATLEIEKMQEQFGHDNVIAVGIHSGPLGFKGSASLLGLATELGDEYYSHFAISYQPQGLVNRTGKQDYQQWAASVRELIQQAAPLTISLDCAYDSVSRQATIDVQALATTGTVDGKLQLWVVEDSITAMQLRYNIVDQPTSGQLQDRQYVHNHVLRAAVNGTWGDEVSISEGQALTKHYAFTADEAWKTEHLSVVAFVYNDAGVVQVEKRHIINQ